jgi:hypothetical protein
VGAVLDLLSTFVTASAPYAQDALTLWSNVITTLADGIRPFVEQLVPAVGNLFNAIAPSIQKIADAIAGFFSGGGGDAIIQFIKDITPGAEKLAGFIADLAKAFFDWLNVNGSDILTTWADWFNSFADWVDKHKDTILAFFNGFLDVIKLLITNLPTFLGLMGALIALNVLSAATNIGKLSLALDGLAAVIRNWPTALLLFGLFEFLTANSKDDGPIGWLGRLRDSLKDIMSFLSPDLANGANGGWDGTVLEDLGKALDAIAGGIKAMGDAAGNALGPLGLLWDLIKNGFQADDSKPAPPEPPTPMTPPPAIPDSNGHFPNQIRVQAAVDDHNPYRVTCRRRIWIRPGRTSTQLQKLYDDFMNGLIKKGDESSDALAGTLGQHVQSDAGPFQ